MLNFDDGENFDTTGELRIDRRKDGYYVIGEGMLIPVDNREEAEEFIKNGQYGRL